MKQSFKTMFVVIITAIAFVLTVDGRCVKKNRKTDHSFFENRFAKYTTVFSRLACLSDKQLDELLNNATQVSVGYGKNVALAVEGVDELESFIRLFHQLMC